MNEPQTIRVLIVDDSPLLRAKLIRALGRCADLAVVGGAKDPLEARPMIIAHRPDVILLDVDMPRMDGITFLRKLLIHYPVPVIMCSEPTAASRQTALRGVSMGAVDLVGKPDTLTTDAVDALALELETKIRSAAHAFAGPPPVLPATRPAPASFQAIGLNPLDYAVFIGASTGGTEAIKKVLAACPADFPPVAIVQHIPEAFTISFAQHLDQASALEVGVAVDHDLLRPGRAYLASGRQMRVTAAGPSLRISYGNRQPVNRHCPSVDVLFDAAARIQTRRLVGVILTGMGGDGARGLLAMAQAGALTIGQDRRSSVVFGMPKVARELGAVQVESIPEEVPQIIMKHLRKRYPNPPEAAPLHAR